MPTIISKELFQQVQDKMDANNHAPGIQKAKELYLLSGLTICGECLRNLGYDMGNTKHCGRNKLKYVTYLCGNRDCAKARKNTELRLHHANPQPQEVVDLCFLLHVT